MLGTGGDTRDKSVAFDWTKWSRPASIEAPDSSVRDYVAAMIPSRWVGPRQHERRPVRPSESWLPPTTDPAAGVPSGWSCESWVDVLRDRLRRTDMPEHLADIYDALANVTPERAERYRAQAAELREQAEALV